MASRAGNHQSPKNRIWSDLWKFLGKCLSKPIVPVVECQTAFALFGVIFGLLVSIKPYVYLHAPHISV
jgi:hypothetical protein